jgi:hypothetical protein
MQDGHDRFRTRRPAARKPAAREPAVRELRVESRVEPQLHRDQLRAARRPLRAKHARGLRRAASAGACYRALLHALLALVRKSRIAAAHDATRALHAAGIANERIIFLPMRGTDVPTPAEVAHVAQGPFQSTTCLSHCHASPRFVSISARRTIAWCSYTVERRLLAAPTLQALRDAVDGLGLVDCADERGGLVKLTRRASAAATVI